MRSPPTPPHPDLVRKPSAPFGWLEAHLLHQHWLQRLQPDAIAVLLLLALAADRHGASYFSRPRMADRLGIDVGRVAAALARLLDLGLVAFKPWRRDAKDGVWQILPVEQSRETRSNTILSVAELLRSLGFAPTAAS